MPAKKKIAKKMTTKQMKKTKGGSAPADATASMSEMRRRGKR